MFKAFMAIPFMKYAIVLVVSVLMIGFVGSNSVWAHFQYKLRISELKDEIEHFEGEYQRDQAQIHLLQSNPKAMERIACERYFMKRAEEDIFVLRDEANESEDSNNETVE